MFDFKKICIYQKQAPIISCSSGYIYAKADDRIIETSLALLDLNLQKPSLGAHITICYEEECNAVPEFLESLTSIEFDYIGIDELILGSYKYLALLIRSEEIQDIRKKMGLPDQLLFRGIKLPLHMTIGKTPI